MYTLALKNDRDISYVFPYVEKSTYRLNVYEYKIMQTFEI